MNDKHWLVPSDNSTSLVPLGLRSNPSLYGDFYTLGFTFEVIAAGLILIVLLLSIFNDELAQRWNMYIILFIAIITLFLMGLLIKSVSVFKFLSENNMTIITKGTPFHVLSIFRSYSFIEFMVNFFCSIMVIGIIFFSFGYMSRDQDEEDDNTDDELDDDIVISDKHNMTLRRDAFKAREVTKQMVPSSTPQPYNTDKRYNAMMLRT